MDVNATPTATLDPQQPLSPPMPPDTFSQQLLNAMLAFRDGDFGARMPTSGPPYMSPAERNLLADWIAEGARDN